MDEQPLNQTPYSWSEDFEDLDEMDFGSLCQPSASPQVSEIVQWPFPQAAPMEEFSFVGHQRNGCHQQQCGFARHINDRGWPDTAFLLPQGIPEKPSPDGFS